MAERDPLGTGFVRPFLADEGFTRELLMGATVAGGPLVAAVFMPGRIPVAARRIR